MTVRSLVLRGAAVLLALSVPWAARGARLLSATTCLKASGQDRCTQATDQVPWESPEVHALVVVGEARPETVVRAVWVSVDAIEPKNFVIQTDERKVASAGAEVPLLFTIAKDEWPAGRYRVDLSVDGQVVRSLPFSVKKASAGGKTAGTPVAQWQPRESPQPAASAPAASPVAAPRTAPPSPPAPDTRPVAAPPAPRPAATPPAREPSAAPGSLAAVAALPPLTGNWEAQGPFGALSLEFPNPGTLVLGGQPFSYTQSATALRVLEEGVPTDYPYTLRQGVLTLQFPQGFSLAFRPVQPAQPALAFPSLESLESLGLPIVPEAPPATPESLLWGSFCTEPMLLGPDLMGIRWCEFDGAGQFTFGQDSGLPYGRVTQGGGTYSLVGDAVQFRFADGSLGAGRVVIRLPDGHAGSLAYGQLLYAGGLCPQGR